MTYKAKSFIAASLMLLGLVFCAPVVSAQNLDNFTITNYNVNLALERDAAQRSVLKTTETITALFPPHQNKGIARDFVKTYDGHTVKFELESVTDEYGNDLEYHWEGDTLKVLTEGVYVEGRKTYKISYTQHDTTRYYADTEKDEFYWDAIGVEWRVPIKQATVDLHLAPELAFAAKTELQCYAGDAGSRRACKSVSRAEAGAHYMIDGGSLQKGEGVTISLGFAPETFVPYQQTTLEKITEWVAKLAMVSNFIIGPIVFLVGVLLLMRRHKRSLVDRGVTAVRSRPRVVEYVTPPGRSVLDSAFITRGTMSGSTVSAQLIDWAVRHYVTVRQAKEKSWWSKPEYTFEAIRSFNDLSGPEQTLATVLFGGTLPVKGSTVTTKELMKRRTNTAKVVQQLPSDLRKSELYEKDAAAKKYYMKIAKNSLIGCFVLLFNIPLLFLAVVAGLFAYNASHLLSKKGAELRSYLYGLRRYIRVAEQDRLAMLQSPEGAEKVGAIDTSDKGARLKLYEKLLPYAMIFGMQKEWTKQLGDLYEETNTSPDWTTGQATFNAAAFSVLVGSVGTSVASASSYSSSSGGSSGGGSAGGGGGGGGGGGA